MKAIAVPRALSSETHQRIQPTIHMQEDGIRADGSIFLSYRNDTIAAIVGHIKEHPVSLVHAPPYSGKTSLCQLLSMRFLQEMGPSNFCFLSMLGSGAYADINSYVKDITGMGINDWLFRDTPTLMLIDELQVTYERKDLLWECV